MTTSYLMYVFTKPTMESFVVYKVTINDKNKFVGQLTPDEIAVAKIIRYVYEKHGGWIKDFTLYNEETGHMGCPGIFGGLGGPKEVPSPDYMSIEEANYALYGEDEDDTSPEQIMNEFNRFEDELIENIKRKKDKRIELLNKIINTWNISTDDVIVYHGIDKFHENSLC